MTKFKCRQDYILVQPVERKQSDVLFVFSEEKFTQGVVVAVGPGKQTKRGINTLTIRPGDKIAYGDLNRGYDFYPKFEENGVIYRLLQEADVCFVMDEETEA